MKPEEQLLRSLRELRALIDSLAGRPASEAGELIRLDLLVRRYPAAARMSLHLLDRPPAVPAPPGWTPTPDTGGLPLWRWTGGHVRVATTDLDRLRFLGTALARFDHMTADELRTRLTGSMSSEESMITGVRCCSSHSARR